MTLYLKRSWHWIDYSLVFFRLCWYIINLFIIISTAPFRPNEQYWMVIWFTASYIIPQLFHLPNRISSFGFILSELILTGSLFVWVTNYSAYVIDLMWIPILSIAFLSATRTQWWAAAGISILPLCIFCNWQTSCRVVPSIYSGTYFIWNNGISVSFSFTKK